jgi:hypothetical protein
VNEKSIGHKEISWISFDTEALSLWHAPEDKHRRAKKLDLAHKVRATVSALPRLIFHALGARWANFR